MLAHLKTGLGVFLALQVYSVFTPQFLTTLLKCLGELGSGAQLSAPKKWTIGPRGEPPGQPSMYKFHRYYIYSPGGISPNVGSLYPIQIYIKIYITKCTFPNPAPKGSTETL